MGFHDDYSFAILASDELKFFKRNFTVQGLTKEETKQLVEKLKHKFNTTAEMATEFKDKLPEKYKPSQSRINEQAEVYEGFNEFLVETEIEAIFNPLGRAASIGSPTIKREEAALLRYIANYGTKENRELLTAKADVLSRAYAKLQDFKERKDESLDLAYQTIEAPLRKLEKEYNDAKNAYHAANPKADLDAVPEIQALKEKIDVLRKPYDDSADSIKKEEAELQAEFDTVLADFVGAFHRIAPEEIKHAAADVDNFIDMQNSSSDPKTIRANYKDSRNRNALYGESVGLLNMYKSRFTDEEFKELNIQFGKAYAFNMKFQADANFLAHPISKFIDMAAMRDLTSEDVSEAANTVSGKVLVDPTKPSESVFLTTLGSMRNQVFHEWSTDIINLFGLQSGNAVFQQDGGIYDFTEDSVFELYEKGKPFYAKPVNTPDAQPILVQPLPGGHLAYGSHITDMQVEEPAAPEAPNPLVSAWDSIISAVGGLFGQDWRVESVVEYEKDMVKYRFDKNCYDGLMETRSNIAELTDSKLLSDMSESMNNYVRTAAEAAEQARLEKGASLYGMTIEEYKVFEQKEAEKKAQAEKLEAERTEKLNKTGLSKKDANKIHDMWSSADELWARAASPSERNSVRLANLITAVTVENMITKELASLNGPEANPMPPALEAFFGKKSPRSAITSMARRIQEEPHFSEFANTIPKEQIEELASGRPDSAKMAKIMHIAVNYNKFKAEKAASKDQSKTLEEKSLSEDNKTMENKDLAMNNPS